jgi:ABC-type sugar transport system ATPase subunit/ribose/xylose/arabinose/galactoside ABC-type transport system permease subunit
MSAAAVVQLLHLRKSFPGVTALQDVSLTLRAGTIHALVGENGAGKSTLINLLSGVLSPDEGEICLSGQPVRFADARAAHRQGIVTVHQEVDLFPDLSVSENIGLEQGLPRNRFGWVDWRSMRQRTRQALQTVQEEMSPSRLAATLSPAQRQLVLIASAVSEAARVLILDEPTSSLSAAETQILFDHLRRFRRQGTAILYVSHRLEELVSLADEVTVLRDGRLVWTGPIHETTPRALIALMVGREVTRNALRQTRGVGPVLLSCQNLTAADGTFNGVNLEVRSGEVVGLYGLIGAGRSEWAQGVFGLRRLAQGKVGIDGKPVVPRGPGQMMREGVAYVPEDRLRQGLCRGLSVRANVVLATLRRLARGPWVSTAEEKQRTRAAIEQFAIRVRFVEQKVSTLSGGNQQKVVLARWLGCEPRVLILDEPTRGVDVGAKAEIHALIHRLADEGRAVVLISSDLPEILSQSDRVAVFREGRLVATFVAPMASAEEVATAAVPQGSEPAKPGTSPKSGLWGTGPAFLREGALVVVLLLLFAFLEWKTGRFLAAGNVQNLATDTALLSFCAVGAALVILSGGIDISLGALMALSAGVAGRLWEQEYPLPVVIATAVLVGGLGGMLNALLSIAGRVHPIVVTLGTMSLYRGLTVWYIGEDIHIPGGARHWIVADFAGLPLVAWGGLLLIFLVWFFLSFTLSGREIYALGSNPTAAHGVGIHPGRVWLKAFTLQGLLVGGAGFLALARSGGLQATSYEEKTLEAIAAAVVGGVAITGGRGSVWGVLLGCLFLVAFAPACLHLNITPEWQQAVVGSVMVLAVTVDTVWRRGGR